MAGKPTPEKTRIYSQRLIIAAVRAGISGNKIGDILKNIGAGWNRANLQAYIRTVKATDPNLPRVNSADFNKFLSDRNFFQVETIGVQRYLHPVDVDVVDPNTGELINTVTVSVSSPVPLTLATILNSIEKNITWGTYGGVPDLSTAKLRQPMKFTPKILT